MVSSRPKLITVGSMFHVARMPGLLPGHEFVLSLVPELEDMFPEGVTRWGRFLLTDPIGKGGDGERFSRMVDTVLEVRRRSEYPGKPSRFQSVFAVESEEVAQKWVTRWGGIAAVYEVKGEVRHRADVRLLDSIPSVHGLIERADRYWQGVPLDNDPAEWELLLVPPVRLIRVIPQPHDGLRFTPG